MTESTVRQRITGDLYRYIPRESHCTHGLALVLEGGQIYDTYWNGLNTNPFLKEYGLIWHGDYLVQLTEENRIGNVSDFRRSTRDECQLYEDADTLFLPVGGGSEQWLVRSNAKPSIAKSIDWKQYKMSQKMASAKYELAEAYELMREIEQLRCGASASLSEGGAA